MPHRKNRRIKPGNKLSLDSLQNQPKQINTPVRLSFEHVEPGGPHCISECEQGELRDVADCLRQLTTLTWNQILQQGGKGGFNKAGLAYTTYPNSALRTVTRPQRLSPDVRIGGVRFSQAGRIFGAYKENVFYILWFDRRHSIVQG